MFCHVTRHPQIKGLICQSERTEFICEIWKLFIFRWSKIGLNALDFGFRDTPSISFNAIKLLVNKFSISIDAELINNYFDPGFMNVIPATILVIYTQYCFHISHKMLWR